MNNLFKKIATAFVGIAMAVGVSVAVGKGSVSEAKAAEGTLGDKLTSANFSNDLHVVLRKGETDTYCTAVGTGWFETGTGLANADEFVINGSATGFSLQEVSSSKYVNNTSQKKFQLDAAASLQFVVSDSGVLSNTNVSGNTYKHNDDNNGFRSYAASNTGTPGYLYILNQGGSTPVDPPVETKYTVTFDVAGGTPAIQSQEVVSGAKATQPAAPTKEGYTFDGWYNGNAKFDFNTAITADITLVAHWTENTTPVDPDNHGKVITDPLTPAEAIALCDEAGAGKIVGGDQLYYVKGVFDTGTTVNTQYHQWYGTLSGTQFKVSGATNDTQVVVEEVNGGMDGKEVIVCGYIELYNNEYKVGYLPASASPTQEKFVPSIVDIKESTPVETKYTVTFDVAGGTPAIQSQEVVSGAKATQPAAPTKEGYTFDGWYNGEAKFDFNTAITGNITLVAHWTPVGGGETPVTYTVTFNSDGGSAVAAVTVESGQKVTEPTAPTKEGYTFDGWYNGETKFDFNTAITGNITLTAHWTENGGQGGGDTPVDPTPAKTVKEIVVSGFDKLNYQVGQDLDLSELKVLIYYTDGTFDVASADQIKVEGYTKTKAGQQVVTISVAGQSKTYKVFVTDAMGCHGSVVASSAIISLTTLLGAGLLMFKKRKED